MKARGFTLVELTVTLAIVALLATLVTPFLQISVQRRKEEKLYDALHEIRVAIDAYKLAGDQGRVERAAGASGYPPTLAVLVEGVEDQSSPVHAKIFFLRHIPSDPMSLDQYAEAATTWGKRSYRSEASAPAEGDDVYDVYSLSKQVGLDGISYRQW